MVWHLTGPRRFCLLAVPGEADTPPLLGFVIAIAVTALTIMAWALYNRPETEPAWPERIQGFAFSPFRAGQDPVSNRYPSVEEIEAAKTAVLEANNLTNAYVRAIAWRGAGDCC